MAQTNILLEAGTNELEIVEFHLEERGADGEVYRGHYGVNVAKVLEIIRKPNITTIPDLKHPAILGAFNQRSRVIPLVDLCVWLAKERAESEPPKVIITEFNRQTTAFLVSGVNRIHRISWEQVEPPNSYMVKVSGYSITGVVRIDERIIFILDLEKIVSDMNPALALKLDSAVDWGSDTGYRALVADDSGMVRQMLSDLLTMAGFIVETVDDGMQAWQRLLQIRDLAEKEGRDVTDYVQVVITDIEMPSVDGHNLTVRIRADSVLRNLPVILFSSLITEKLRHKGVSVGADDQISKPEVTQLASRAKNLIREKLQKR